MGEHRMERSPLNHGDGQWCAKCKATDREIRFALGPVCRVEDPKPNPMTPSVEMKTLEVAND